MSAASFGKRRFRIYTLNVQLRACYGLDIANFKNYVIIFILHIVNVSLPRLVLISDKPLFLNGHLQFPIGLLQVFNYIANSEIMGDRHFIKKRQITF